MKEFELISLEWDIIHGCYVAGMYNNKEGYFNSVRFYFSNKKAVIRSLRNKWSCSVGRKFDHTVR